MTSWPFGPLTDIAASLADCIRGLLLSLPLPLRRSVCDGSGSGTLVEQGGVL